MSEPKVPGTSIDFWTDHPSIHCDPKSDSNIVLENDSNSVKRTFEELMREVFELCSKSSPEKTEKTIGTSVLY